MVIPLLFLLQYVPLPPGEPIVPDAPSLCITVLAVCVTCWSTPEYPFLFPDDPLAPGDLGFPAVPDAPNLLIVLDCDYIC